MTFKKKPVLISAGVIAALVVVLVGMHFTSAGTASDNGGMGIPVKPDYSLVPIYTMQGDQTYMNATATPLLFLDRSETAAGTPRQFRVCCRSCIRPNPW